MARKVKKKIEIVDGQEVAQDIQNAKFVREFNKWKNGDAFEFLIRHGIGSKRSNTAVFAQSFYGSKRFGCLHGGRAVSARSAPLQGIQALASCRGPR